MKLPQLDYFSTVVVVHMGMLVSDSEEFVFSSQVENHLLDKKAILKSCYNPLGPYPDISNRF